MNSEIWTLLAAPFDRQEIKWRVGNSAPKKDTLNIRPLAYIDARCVMDRLDQVVGPNNWQTKFEETNKGRVICYLSIRIDGDWITKADGAGDTGAESEKGAISDALKRAAVQFGINRSMYNFDSTWIEVPIKGNTFKDKRDNFRLNDKGNKYLQSNGKVPENYYDYNKRVETTKQAMYNQSKIETLKIILWEFLKDEEGKVDPEIIEELKTYSQEQLKEEILKYKNK